MTQRAQMMVRTVILLAGIWFVFGLVKILGTDQIGLSDRVALGAFLLIPAGLAFAAWWLFRRKPSDGKTIL